jgi:hypothetical protein
MSNSPRATSLSDIKNEVHDDMDLDFENANDQEDQDEREMVDETPSKKKRNRNTSAISTNNLFQPNGRVEGRHLILWHRKYPSICVSFNSQVLIHDQK